MDLKLTLSCLASDRTYPLYDGLVKPKGIDLNAVLMRDEDPYWSWRKQRNVLFDVSEMSISNYFIQLDHGNDDVIALPVFLSRGFRHSNIFVNTASGIETAKDLIGKNVGLSFYDPTTPVWIRGFLKHQYGVAPTDLKWHVYEMSLKGTDLPVPEGLDIQFVPRSKRFEQMLLEGELDVMLNAGVPPKSYVNGDPRIRPLFADFHAEELQFYEQFRLFPIIHTVVMKRSVFNKFPWAAQSLYDAFCLAKRQNSLSSMALDGHLKYSLPLLHAHVEETIRVFGTDDPWVYGMDKNRREIDTLLNYCFEQGLLRSPLNAEEAFVSDLNETWT